MCLLLKYLNNVEKYLKQWFSTDSGFVPRRHMAMSGCCLGCFGEGGLLLASGGETPEMPLNFLQCLGQSLETKNYLAPNVNSAKFEKLGLKGQITENPTTQK